MLKLKATANLRTIRAGFQKLNPPLKENLENFMKTTKLLCFYKTTYTDFPLLRVDQCTNYNPPLSRTFHISGCQN